MVVVVHTIQKKKIQVHLKDLKLLKRNHHKPVFRFKVKVTKIQKVFCIKRNLIKNILLFNFKTKKNLELYHSMFFENFSPLLRCSFKF